MAAVCAQHCDRIELAPHIVVQLIVSSMYGQHGARALPRVGVVCATATAVLNNRVNLAVYPVHPQWLVMHALHIHAQYIVNSLNGRHGVIVPSRAAGATGYACAVLLSRLALAALVVV